jgi:2-methylisocitrate lyase-like PEP mutase family enzyme
MTELEDGPSARFRRLHAPGELLVLPNAWDAGSARLIESCGASAIATTSAGLAWVHGYPDGNALPPHVLAAAVGEIVRVVGVPVTVDVEGGYAIEPEAVGDVIAAVVDAGGVGINIEDGAGAPDLLCAKIAAAKKAAGRAGIDLFVNARTDVFLKRLVPVERAIGETIARAARYRAAGCDGVFVPGVSEAPAIRELAASIELPLNVMVLPSLPPVAELRRLGVRRVSAGAAIAQAVYGLVRREATRMLNVGRYEGMFETVVTYPEMNGLLAR